MAQTESPAITAEQVYAVLRRIIDPELGINMVDLGLIYGVRIQGGAVSIRMTLTTRGCPLHTSFVQAVERAIRTLPGVTQAAVEVVWEPRWTPDLMTTEGKQALAG